MFYRGFVITSLLFCGCSADTYEQPSVQDQIVDAYVSSDQFTEQEARCVVDKISGEVDLAALNANIKSRADQGATSLPGITAQQQSIINQAIQACRGNSHAPTTL